jgi:hypothetical protein
LERKITREGKEQYRDWYRIGKVERKRRNDWKRKITREGKEQYRDWYR